MKVTYMPPEGEADFTETHGQMFERGQAVEVTDERKLEKLKGHPHFRVGNEKPKAEAEGPNKDDERLAKAIDGRTKEAREAREKASSAQADADAKERAAAQVQALAAARRDAE